MFQVSRHSLAFGLHATEMASPARSNRTVRRRRHIPWRFQNEILASGMRTCAHVNDLTCSHGGRP